MNGINSKIPDNVSTRARNPQCLETRDVPGVCLRLEAARQSIAIPYALLLRVELSTDESGCNLTFATHEVSIRGRWLRPIYVAVSQGQAVQVGVGNSVQVTAGGPVTGPLVTGMQIDPLDESARARR